MIDPDFSLSWPTGLFVWEARRLLQISAGSDWPDMVRHLVEEAFEDVQMVEYFDEKFTAPAEWANALNVLVIKKWLEDLIADPNKLVQYNHPKYWAERHDKLDENMSHGRVSTMAEDWVALIDKHSAEGYLPRILPVPCVDAHSSWPDPERVTAEIQRATHLRVEWPLTPDSANSLPESVLYSLIEYFHDQSQRPRTASYHSFNDCGYHYSDFNRDSGGAVYRWRVNGILEAHGVPYRLGIQGDERGRLVRYFGGDLDSVLSGQLSVRHENPKDEVVHAIRMFRARGATTTDKRAALALLARDLEPRRKAIGQLVSKGDESDIFNIANNFNIRHNTKQKTEYGEEFLDWIFWNYLAMIQLMDALKSGRGKPSDNAADDSGTSA
ncbi:hypothetical protein [Sinomonas sp. ASV322]|uniref:hypothetical protein n=1 Tax=Sinomonas sp. ASV322 TaxID=3041920 RepID=UPI0027DE4B4E|nr:hypothetical protein [Sinomonas sp. ASV322]MDQ4500757.1 hypothetical protein [Sinomonas sp. ASV322]